MGALPAPLTPLLESAIIPCSTSTRPAAISGFSDQLTACLEECAHGRSGLFGTDPTSIAPWPEADQLRQLAMALQPLLAQQSQAWPEPDSADAAPDPDQLLIHQFLDLCTIHGEAHPGEPRLAREFLRELANPTPPSPQASRPW